MKIVDEKVAKAKEDAKGCLIAFTLMPVGVFFRGFVVFKLWSWFLLGIIGYQPSYWHVLGLIATLKLMTGGLNNSSKAKVDDLTIGLLSHCCVKPALVLLFGYVIKTLFM